MGKVIEKLMKIEGKLIPLSKRLEEFAKTNSREAKFYRDDLLAELVRIGSGIEEVTEEYKNRAAKAKIWNYPDTIDGMGAVLVEIEKVEKDIVSELEIILCDIEMLEKKMDIIII